ncbi:TolC family protein [Bacteroides gallinaceum]|uniref:TolC family protein n=1 Tax=Phocaeicola intestinalis TaxID=2762212 RepID=A0ABR8Y6P0_9BACT|nr:MULTISPECIES: TolC family protein [Bacteroidaceae]CCZ71059.1 outer membrane efflux protein [Bacteroides sp. CAG:702]MBD8039844.1 TolC family protein [Phocaeicola intestinalis]MBM6659570.1 TolC family protein [Bacteroides gallinaceum]MBM6721025.1 TolC family protein [Bacteroides gallinaceum]MBM6945026.1 TolC family protein [Bacteroides gallinaceum]
MKFSYLFIGIGAMCMPVHAQQAWTLKKCIDYAIEHNLTIKQQEASAEQSKIELSTAKNSRLPDLNGSASHSFSFGRSLQADNTYNSINTQNTGFSLSTSVPLFTGLQIPNNIALSKLNLQAALEDLNAAKENVSIQVASSYLQVLFNDELARVAHEQVDLSREMLVQREAYFRNGKASESELYEAKSRVAQDELSAVQADNDYQLALLDLSQLLELPSPDGFAIVSPQTDAVENLGTPLPPAEIYADALLIKPVIKAAQYRLEGAQKSIRIAQSAYYPQLSLGAGLSTNYYKMSGMDNAGFGSQLRDNFSQYVGLTLSIPIFNRLATRNRVRSARIQQTTLGWQLEDSKKTLYKEIQQAYYNTLSAQTQYTSSRTAAEAAKASFDLMKERYMNGKANATEFNESRTAWMRAVSDQLQAKYNYIFRFKILDFYRGVPLELK